ncbi:uncharacterized protein [Setaria viridis]|uniref:uncharacterized protein n=1 Tax=Setaria viridis TaxID=4556 RepID=UPI003B3B9551
MDFIEGLPKSEGYDTILVVVDRFSKYAHFIPLHHPFIAQTVAQTVFDNVMKLHGLPKSIVSDRDKVFTSHFWTELLKLMDITLNMSTTYHPQTDGQSERCSPFKAVYGYDPNPIAAPPSRETTNSTPYAQHSVVNRPSPKLGLKYYGPYTVLERIGKAAYKLELPTYAKVYPVFHVSQLKPFTPNYTPVYHTLPKVLDPEKENVEPESILERRLVKKGNNGVVKVRVKWTNLPAEATTWEDDNRLRAKFPSTLAWGLFRWGAVTTSAEATGKPQDEAPEDEGAKDE